VAWLIVSRQVVADTFEAEVLRGGAGGAVRLWGPFNNNL
jgi:hypothetical protein